MSVRRTIKADVEGRSNEVCDLDNDSFGEEVSSEEAQFPKGNLHPCSGQSTRNDNVSGGTFEEASPTRPTRKSKSKDDHQYLRTVEKNLPECDSLTNAALERRDIPSVQYRLSLSFADSEDDPSSMKTSVSTGGASEKRVEVEGISVHKVMSATRTQPVSDYSASDKVPLATGEISEEDMPVDFMASSQIKEETETGQDIGESQFIADYEENILPESSGPKGTISSTAHRQERSSWQSQAVSSQTYVRKGSVGRNVSFNDSLLVHSETSTLEQPCKSESNSRSASPSPPTVPDKKTSPSLRRLFTTPGRIQTQETTQPSEDPSSGAEGSQSKKSIKNLTSTLAHRLSFKSSKSSSKKMFTSFDSTFQDVNGIDPQNARKHCAEGIQSFSELLKLFQCPGCSVQMSPPLYECRKGHLVCGQCKTSLKGSCPTCKQRVTDNRNIMMEQKLKCRKQRRLLSELSTA